MNTTVAKFDKIPFLSSRGGISFLKILFSPLVLLAAAASHAATAGHGCVMGRGVHRVGEMQTIGTCACNVRPGGNRIAGN